MCVATRNSIAPAAAKSTAKRIIIFDEGLTSWRSSLESLHSSRPLRAAADLSTLADFGEETQASITLLLNRAMSAAAEGAPKPVKKVRPGPPLPPAGVGAACCFVRVAAATVLGVDAASALAGTQPVWVTEPGACKLTLNLDASARDPFPKTSLAHAALLDAVAAELAALQERGAALALGRATRLEAEAACAAAGVSPYDANGRPKGAQDADVVELVSLEGALWISNGPFYYKQRLVSTIYLEQGGKEPRYS